MKLFLLICLILLVLLVTSAREGYQTFSGKLPEDDVKKFRDSIKDVNSPGVTVILSYDDAVKNDTEIKLQSDSTIQQLIDKAPRDIADIIRINFKGNLNQIFKAGTPLDKVFENLPSEAVQKIKTWMTTPTTTESPKMSTGPPLTLPPPGIPGISSNPVRVETPATMAPQAEKVLPVIGTQTPQVSPVVDMGPKAASQAGPTGMMPTSTQGVASAPTQQVVTTTPTQQVVTTPNPVELSTTGPIKTVAEVKAPKKQVPKVKNPDTLSTMIPKTSKPTRATMGDKAPATVAGGADIKK